MQRETIIGIDPGRNGGVVAVSGVSGRHIVSVNSMPATPTDLYYLFLELGMPKMQHGLTFKIYIEDVHSMPSDGSKAAFTFGRGLGHIEGVLASMGFPERSERYNRVRPRAWQQYFGINKSKDEKKYDYKKRLKDLARDQFLLRSTTDTKKAFKTSDLTMKTADAYLIALYGADQNEQHTQITKA